ncbi:MAG: D-ala D-ala ligase N-terminus, partial [Modestobacter sp.]|nr:D-ala D-ala ligase N-terminus [Modestobacter sp.]
MQRVAVVFGGPSSEHDISILTGLQAARLISQAGKEV